MREPAKKFEDLLVWRKAHALVLTVYRVSRRFPQEERYGLTHQLRRCAASVPANIAEAFKKRSNADKARVLNIAQSSLEETRYFLILARDLEYVASDEALSLLEEVSRMMDSYTRKILGSGS
jgi:four helix bundle protein